MSNKTIQYIVKKPFKCGEGNIYSTEELLEQTQAAYPDCEVKTVYETNNCNQADLLIKTGCLCPLEENMAVELVTKPIPDGCCKTGGAGGVTEEQLEEAIGNIPPDTDTNVLVELSDGTVPALNEAGNQPLPPIVNPNTCLGNKLTDSSVVFPQNELENLGIGFYIKWTSSEEDACLPATPPKPDMCWATIREDGIPFSWEKGGPWEEHSHRPHKSNGGPESFILTDLINNSQGTSVLVEHCSPVVDNRYECIEARFTYNSKWNQFRLLGVTPDWRIRYKLIQKRFIDGQQLGTDTTVWESGFDTRNLSGDSDVILPMSIPGGTIDVFAPAGSEAQVCLCLEWTVVNKGTSINLAQIGSWNIPVQCSAEQS